LFRQTFLKSTAVFCGMQERHDCIEAGPAAGQSIISPSPKSSAGQSLLHSSKEARCLSVSDPSMPVCRSFDPLHKASGRSVPLSSPVSSSVSHPFVQGCQLKVSLANKASWLLSSSKKVRCQRGLLPSPTTSNPKSSCRCNHIPFLAQL
jgi:hypothetical protein